MSEALVHESSKMFETKTVPSIARSMSAAGTRVQRHAVGMQAGFVDARKLLEKTTECISEFLESFGRLISGLKHHQ